MGLIVENNLTAIEFAIKVELTFSGYNEARTLITIDADMLISHPSMSAVITPITSPRDLLAKFSTGSLKIELIKNEAIAHTTDATINMLIIAITHAIRYDISEASL